MKRIFTTVFVTFLTAVTMLNAQSITGLGTEYCLNDNAVFLTFDLPSAQLSGPGVSPAIGGFTFSPFQAGVGIHDVVLIFAGNNSSSPEVIVQQVKVKPNPAVPTISPSGVVTITQGESVELTSSSQSGNLWIPTEETTQSIQVSQAGQYRVRVMDEDGCSSLSLRTTVFVEPGIIDPPPPPAECYAMEVVSYLPAKQNDGTDIDPAFTNPENALGMPQNSDEAVSPSQANFVSLGFGGSITLKMSGPIKNGPGNDFRVVETTYGVNSGNCNRYPEKVQAFASQDGCNWLFVGEGCQDVEFDLGPLNWARFIRLVDSSPITAAFNNQIANGYDVDGVVCLNGFSEDETEQDFGALYAMEIAGFNQAFMKNGSAISASRSNPAQALGAPQNNNTINFVALGFGGSVTLKLGYVVFDKEGDDLQIVETSFGNPTCNSYPERALIEVSLDGSNFTELGELCLDGTVDFATGGVAFAQYVRITDRSNATRFGGTADGYDVDGIMVIQPGCYNDPTARNTNDNIWVADEITSFDAFPNPFQNLVNVQIQAGSENEQALLEVLNIAGQRMLSKNINIASQSIITESFDLSAFGAGVYFVRLNSREGIQNLKVIKQ
ncbi:MAG: T9SS type A sorting domain-containing protein [Flavobacteriales bacterium]